MFTNGLLVDNLLLNKLIEPTIILIVFYSTRHFRCKNGSECQLSKSFVWQEVHIFILELPLSLWVERQVFENLLICIKEEILEVGPLSLLKLCQLLFGKTPIPKTLDFIIMFLIFNSKIRASGACLARRYPIYFTFFSLDGPSLLDHFK